MKASALMLFAVSCGTSQAPPEETPPQTRSEAVAENVEAREGEAAHAAAEQPALPEEPASVPAGPRNFVTPHHCHPPGPCEFEFETLRGAQHIDVGHGHPAAPELEVVLRIGEGRARLESIQATASEDARGVVVARPRDSLEGGAFYVTLDGEASAAEVVLSFRPE